MKVSGALLSNGLLLFCTFTTTLLHILRCNYPIALFSQLSQCFVGTFVASWKDHCVSAVGQCGPTCPGNSFIPTTGNGSPVAVANLTLGCFCTYYRRHLSGSCHSSSEGIQLIISQIWFQLLYWPPHCGLALDVGLWLTRAAAAHCSHPLPFPACTLARDGLVHCKWNDNDFHIFVVDLSIEGDQLCKTLFHRGLLKKKN